MSFSIVDFYKALELIQKRIPYKIYMKPINRSKIKKEVEVLLKSEIKNMNEAIAFIKAYESITGLNFNLISNEDGSSSDVCNRKWICTHGIVSGLNKECTASIRILIKKIDNKCLWQDACFKTTLSFPAVIRFKLNHNHRLTFPLPSYKLLKVNKDVKLCFYEYFKRGYFGRRAKLLHEQYLQKASFFVLNDESMNPSLHAIYTLANNWLKLTRSMEINKAPVSRNSELQMLNIKKESQIGQSASQNVNINEEVTKLKQEPSDEFTTAENIAIEIMEAQPALSIKQEIIDEDENNELPVILSYSSLAVSSPLTLPPPPEVKTSVVQNTTKPSTQNATAFVNMVQPFSAQVVVYDQLSNTYKVVKCLSVSTDNYSTNRYKSYLPTDFVTTKMSLQRL